MPQWRRAICERCGVERRVLLGSWIRERRRYHGLSQERLAALVGISRGYLSELESDKKYGYPDLHRSIIKELT